MTQKDVEQMLKAPSFTNKETGKSIFDCDDLPKEPLEKYIEEVRKKLEPPIDEKTVRWLKSIGIYVSECLICKAKFIKHPLDKNLCPNCGTKIE